MVACFGPVEADVVVWPRGVVGHSQEEGCQDLADGREIVIGRIVNDWHDGCSGPSKKCCDGIGFHDYCLRRHKGAVKIVAWAQKLRGLLFVTVVMLVGSRWQAARER